MRLDEGNKGPPLAFLFACNVALTVAILCLFVPAASRSSARAMWGIGGLSVVFVAPFHALYLGLVRLPRLRPVAWIVVLESLRTMVLVVDLAVYRLMGVHATDPQFLNNVREPRFLEVIGASWRTALLIVAIVLGSAALQVLFLVLRGLAGRLLARWPRVRAGLAAAVLFAAAGLVAGTVRAPASQARVLSERLPLWPEVQRLWHPGGFDKAGHMAARKRATVYPLRALPPVDRAAIDRPDILMVLAETIRADVVNPVDMPNLYAVSRTEGMLVPARHYSGGHQTWEGAFSALYALGGWQHDTFRDKPLPPATVVALEELGYRTIALASSSLTFPGYAPMREVFDEIYDVGEKGAVEGDRLITDRAAKILEDRRSGKDKDPRPVFIFMFYDATHHPFAFPKEHEVYKPYASSEYDPLVQGVDYQMGWWNRYRNALHYVDTEIGRLWTAIAPSRAAGRLAFVLTSDHGEEFWDHGLYGHGLRRLDNIRTQVPLLLSYPGVTLPPVALSSHMDVFPTLFDLMKVPWPAGDWSDGRSLRSPRPVDYVMVNGYNFPDSEVFALVTPRFKVYARRTPGYRMEVNEVTDPDDRPIPWDRFDTEPVIRAFMRDADRFQPGYRLFRSERILSRRIPGYPLPPTLGPARTAATPEKLPWEALGDLSAFVTTTQPPVKQALHVRFDPWIELVGVSVSADRLVIGDTLVVELVYKCIQTPPREVDIFNHMFGPDPPGWQNLEHTPLWGNLAPADWKAGTYIRDVLEIPSCDEWGPGTADVRMGFYNVKTQKRVPVKAPQAKDDAVLVAHVEWLPPVPEEDEP